MEPYLCSDIINNISQFLDKKATFNFFNIAKFMVKYRHLIYDKYLFDIEMVQTCKISYQIKHLKCCNLKLIHVYPNLISLEIRNEYFKSKIANLPLGLKKLVINSHDFNLPLDNLPENLESLIIKGRICHYPTIFENSHFNKPMDKLPKKLLQLEITSERFDQSLDNLPSSLQSLIITSNRFNQTLDYLPKTLHTLKIMNRHFDKPLNLLPENLNTLVISPLYNLNFDALPKSIKNITRPGYE